MGSLQVGQYVSDDSNSLPVGTIVMYLKTTAPPGWLLCDGASYAIASYPALHAVVGTQYGDIGGFKVPNLVARIPVGPGVSFSSTLGTTGGVDSVTLTAAESGYPSHTHSTTDVNATTGSAVVNSSPSVGSDWNPQDISRNTTNNSTTNVNATSSHENRMPFYTLAYIIKAL